jgi:hypothetical protein
MTARVWPVDAVGVAPLYSGRALRQLLGSLITGGTAARPLGGRSGVTPGTPSNTVTATTTTWSVKTHSGCMDVEASVIAGPYLYAFDTAVSGSMNAADATNPRIDLVSVQMSDPAESDGTSTPSVAIIYTAGTAAASPAVPIAPARSLVLARLTVPAAGGGSPSVLWVAPVMAAAGGIVPVTGPSQYPVSPYVGQYIDDASLGLLRWDGSAWQTYGKGGDITANLTLATGSGTAKYRQIGKLVQITFVAAGQSIPTGSTGTTIVAAGGLPVAARPSDNVYDLCNFGGQKAGTALVLADGSVSALNDTGTTVTNFRCGFTYLAA